MAHPPVPPAIDAEHGREPAAAGVPAAASGGALTALDKDDWYRHVSLSG
jgi:hypothetical protein